jgi:hypothetical protein
MDRSAPAPPVDGREPAWAPAGLSGHLRALTSRLWPAQGSLAADLVVVPDPPPLPDPLRARNAPATVPVHPRATMPCTIPQLLPPFPFTVSGIPVNQPLMWLTVIPAR